MPKLQTIAAACVAIALVTTYIALTGMQGNAASGLTACEVNSRGEAILWAQEHPGVDPVATCGGAVGG